MCSFASQDWILKNLGNRIVSAWSPSLVTTYLTDKAKNNKINIKLILGQMYRIEIPIKKKDRESMFLPEKHWADRQQSPNICLEIFSQLDNVMLESPHSWVPLSKSRFGAWVCILLPVSHLEDLSFG